MISNWLTKRIKCQKLLPRPLRSQESRRRARWLPRFQPEQSSRSPRSMPRAAPGRETFGNAGVAICVTPRLPIGGNCAACTMIRAFSAGLTCGAIRERRAQCRSPWLTHRSDSDSSSERHERSKCIAYRSRPSARCGRSQSADKTDCRSSRSSCFFKSRKAWLDSRQGSYGDLLHRAPSPPVD